LRQWGDRAPRPARGVFAVLLAITVVPGRSRRTSSDQPVIADGPYGVLRHTTNTGMLLAVAGLGLLIGNWVSVVAPIACVGVGLVHRIRVEERALLPDLGDRYRDDAKTRRRLIPFVW
jgi:protein-S-isoprenylcysteine O-methyltransferase Ste14